MWYAIVEWMFAVYKSLVFCKEEQNIHSPDYSKIEKVVINSFFFVFVFWNYPALVTICEAVKADFSHSKRQKVFLYFL